MAKLTIVASLVARKGCEDLVEAELTRMIAPTRSESGCIEYRLYRDNENPAMFLFYETWSNREAFEEHKKTGHYLCYVDAVKELLMEKTVRRLTLIA